MNTLAKLEEIRDEAEVYAILFRNAGVGIQFFEPSRVTANPRDKDGFRDGLVVYRYYENIEDAIEAEHARIFNNSAGQVRDADAKNGA